MFLISRYIYPLPRQMLLSVYTKRFHFLLCHSVPTFQLSLYLRHHVTFVQSGRKVLNDLLVERGAGINLQCCLFHLGLFFVFTFICVLLFTDFLIFFFVS